MNVKNEGHTDRQIEFDSQIFKILRYIRNTIKKYKLTELEKMSFF
jgi:hypothetical protein